MDYVVKAEWDAEAKVWVATSDDIPGLVTEAATWDELVRRILAVVPELLSDKLEPETEVPVSVMAQQNERVRVRA